jgi:tRNA threonylcarbamoyladenosine biosynthesis protein TsaE
MKKFLTKNPKETKELGKKIGKRFLKNKSKKLAKIITLEGDLGGGKTTFLSGFAKGLGIKEKILSPTFILIRKFNIKHPTSNFEHFYHIDCYRIKKPREILTLGLKEIVNNPKNIVAIEWPERIKEVLPKKVLKIKFKILGKEKREILLKWPKNF